MGTFRVASDKALLSVLQRSKNEIAVLIGSPLSSPYQSKSKGVPDVGGILKLIDKYLDNDPELKQDYKNEVLDKFSNDNERYQKSFEFLADYTDPDTLNLIIRQAVLESADVDISKVDCLNLDSLIPLQNKPSIWHLPPGTEALAGLLTNHKFMKGPVLTTNFDPLMTVALENLGYEPNRTVLHGDGSLDQLQSNHINIVHMHGFWIKSDTMHTQSQLRLPRPKLKSSLSRILKDKTLLVIGYGGWDDIFMQALRDIMDDDSANFNVLWAFYENDTDLIKKRYGKLINAVQPAIGRNRFRMYGGINCHEFLPKLHNKIVELNSTEPSTVNPPTVEAKPDQQSNSNAIFKDTETSTPEWKILSNPAHQHIREVERSEINELLKNSNKVNLVCDWGLGKDEFISTLIKDEKSPVHQARLYRIDLESVVSKSELLDKIELDFGCGLQNFISGMTSDKSLLLLDNLDTNLAQQNNKDFIDVLQWLITVITDYNTLCKIILCSKNYLQPDIPFIKLSKLEEFDIRSYITNHTSIQHRPDEHVFESLIELSQGIPSFIDRYINELDYFSIDEIYESHFSPEAHKHDFDSNYPDELRKRVNSLALRQETHSFRSYELLKTLSILENGDSFTNLKKSNSNFNFHPSHLKELYSLELIESVSINKSLLSTTPTLGGEKLHILPPIVRQFVYSQLTTKEIYEIVKQLAKIHLGKSWKSGALNLCTVTKDLISEGSKSIGSTHIILIHLLRCSIELNNGNGIESAMRISEAYCNYLSRNKRFREQIKFIDQIKAISKESNKAKCSLILEKNEGEAFRMLGQSDKAEIILLHVYEKLKENENPEKDLLKSTMSSLALLYEGKKNLPQANKFAMEILQIDSNHVDARYIIATTSEHTSINELKELELQLRNNKNYIAANNTAFHISDLENSINRKITWLDKVLQCKSDQYNKYRAIVKKGSLIISEGMELELNREEIRTLHAGYIYFFSQKMTSLFNSTHRVLWNHYSKTNNFSILFKMFQQSSLFWRIYENHNNENHYSNELFEIIRELLPKSFDLSQHKYVTFRIRQISDKSLTVDYEQ